MSAPSPARRQWGRTPITGGRNAFRIGLLAQALARRVAVPATVLDAGCGDGALTLTLARMNFNVTGVDAAEGGLRRLAAAIGSDAGPGRAVCLPGEVGALPFPDRSFDAVVSGEVLEHLADDAAAIREFRRVLKPGGLCVVSVPANPRRFGIEDEWAGHLRRYTRPGLAQLFMASGLRIVDLHYWGWPVTYLYNRILYQAWLKRRLRAGEADPLAAQSLGGNAVVIRAMAAAFAIDRLFFRLPFGIGLIGVFRAP
jgi:2-polyprenyl-3-methyl-5-hydroxy-6-metoxy-1,4-benzoquinol methylase